MATTFQLLIKCSSPYTRNLIKFSSFGGRRWIRHLLGYNKLKLKLKKLKLKLKLKISLCYFCLSESWCKLKIFKFTSTFHFVRSTKTHVTSTDPSSILLIACWTICVASSKIFPIKIRWKTTHSNIRSSCLELGKHYKFIACSQRSSCLGCMTTWHNFAILLAPCKIEGNNAGFEQPRPQGAFPVGFWTFIYKLEFFPGNFFVLLNIA